MYREEQEEPCCDVTRHLIALRRAFPHLYVPDVPKECDTGSVYVELTCRQCFERFNYPTPGDLETQKCCFMIRFGDHGRSNDHPAPNCDFGPEATTEEVVSSCKSFADEHRNCGSGGPLWLGQNR
jgi:hypothetical protein